MCKWGAQYTALIAKSEWVGKQFYQDFSNTKNHYYATKLVLHRQCHFHICTLAYFHINYMNSFMSCISLSAMLFAVVSKLLSA